MHAGAGAAAATNICDGKLTQLSLSSPWSHRGISNPSTSERIGKLNVIGFGAFTMITICIFISELNHICVTAVDVVEVFVGFAIIVV